MINGSKVKSMLSNNPLTPQNPAVRKLMEWKKPSMDMSMHDLKWCEKAVKSLVKKVKRTGMLDELMKSVTLQEINTRCITIPRSLDGRVQVCQRKGIPHVIYCRIWRFPEIQSHHQLKPMPHCIFAYHFKKDEVCVNPYHYEKNDSSAIPPVLVPKMSYLSQHHLLHYQNTLNGQHHCRVNFFDSSLNASSNNSNGGGPISPVTLPASLPPNRGVHDKNDNCHDQQLQLSYMQQQQQAQSLDSSTTNHIFKLEVDTSPMSYDLPQIDQSKFLFPPNVGKSPEGYISDDEHSTIICNDDATWPANNIAPPDLNTPHHYSTIEYCEPPFWCSVNYYELNQRVGETFHASQQSLIVDGFVDPSNAERFCLGLLSNINRDPSVVEIRKHIGKGARFYVIGAEVYVQCLSDHAIFVQSTNVNVLRSFPENTVCKVPPGCNLKIFDNNKFAQFLSDCVRRGFDPVYALTRMCSVRLSFVKGWGAYYRRQNVMHTPCWVELHLNGPYQWLDRVLREMRPNSSVHSDT